MFFYFDRVVWETRCRKNFTLYKNDSFFIISTKIIFCNRFIIVFSIFTEYFHNVVIDSKSRVTIIYFRVCHPSFNVYQFIKQIST